MPPSELKPDKEQKIQETSEFNLIEYQPPKDISFSESNRSEIKA